jgi:D-amino peptidase
VYVSVDLEGVGGLCTRSEVYDLDRGSPDFQRSQRLMTDEVNAAVEGAYAAGAEAVLVNDSHGSMRNLLLDRLDPRAEVVRGNVKEGVMTAGLDDTFDAALLLGYHARAGMPGVLAHTLSGAQLVEVRLDGEPIGEIGLSGVSAQEAGVPVVFLSGDDHACAEAREFLGADLRTFATKRAIDRSSARLLPPETCCAGIRDGVRDALAVRPVKPEPATSSHVLRCTWRSTTAAHVASWVPGVTRVDESTTEMTVDSVRSGVDLLVVMLLAATGLEA